MHARDDEFGIAAPQPTYSPTPLPVDRFVDGIREIASGLITKQKLYDYLVSYAIERSDLERFRSWQPDRHTRNKIFRNDRIEVMLLCWPVGVKTPLHTHNGQLGWMTMIEGRLVVENFRKISCNRPENQQVVGLDCLAGATEIEMQKLDTEIAIPGGPLNTVDKEQTIHRIINPPEWNQPAVSMHVYSLPIESCVVFDLEKQTCYRRELKYDNE